LSDEPTLGNTKRDNRYCDQDRTLALECNMVLSDDVQEAEHKPNANDGEQNREPIGRVFEVDTPRHQCATAAATLSSIIRPSAQASEPVGGAVPLREG